MNIQVEHPETCVALATVEVDETRMEEARERAFREYSKLVTVPGFRKGKAPRALVLPMLPDGAVDEHAEEIVTSIVYKALLEEANLEPYAPGSVDNVSKEEGKPLTIRFRIPLRPVITLGELDNLTARRQVAPV
ncbi:MAG TPA: trigger factor family protein, partial [Armatimonadota bacterium]|nr:trigger factor family protein [Armatimonadota bacterium]